MNSRKKVNSFESLTPSLSVIQHFRQCGLIKFIKWINYNVFRSLLKYMIIIFCVIILYPAEYSIKKKTEHSFELKFNSQERTSWISFVIVITFFKHNTVEILEKRDYPWRNDLHNGLLHLSEFELQSRFLCSLPDKYPWDKCELHYPSSYGLKITTALLRI